jgi:hypothetical protein
MSLGCWIDLIPRRRATSRLPPRAAAGTGTGRVRNVIVNSWGRNADLVNRLHRLLSRVWPCTAVDAADVHDAVARILVRWRPDDRIGRLQFWGHGRPGAMTVGDEELTAESFTSGHAHGTALSSLLPYLSRDAIIFFEGCQTFAGRDGKTFAQAAAAFFGPNRTVSGHTRLLGYNLDWGGAARLQLGQEPSWPEVDPLDKALKKQWFRCGFERVAARWDRVLRRLRGES